MDIIYEQHPVTAERKAELRAQGYRIIDARFAPAAPAPASADFSPEGIDAMGKADVVELIEAHGASADRRKGVAKLRAQLKEIMFL